MAPGGPLNRFVDKHNFSLDTSIPDLSDKVIIVTGGNSGVGKETVLQLAKHSPSKIYLTARSKSKYDAALADITKLIGTQAALRIHHLELDLSSFKSIKDAADKFLASNTRLDLLINNAGIMATPPDRTAQGFEIQFGTNHLGHALFTKLLLPTLLSTASSHPNLSIRVVNLSSVAVLLAPTRTGLPFLSSPSRNNEIYEATGGHRWTYTRYGTSKIANVYHARSLAKYYSTPSHPNFTAVSVHPGRVDTALLNDRFSYLNLTGWFQWTSDKITGLFTVEEGAMNQLWAAVAPAGPGKEVETGKFYYPVGLEQVGVGDDKTAEKLWVWQEEIFDKWLATETA